MSFIYGIVHFDGEPVKPEEIQALSQAVKWDNFSEVTEVEKNYALGYSTHPGRKSKAGIFKYENVIILADIRIYNSAELKKSFDFESPEEAFAKAYHRWGIQCANRINGDFVVAVIDQTKNEVHLFRDHIGARPLIYWFSGNRLLIASHEFGLVKSGLVKTGLSEEKLISCFFRYKGIYAQTVFQKIHKVIPGHSVSFSAGQKKKLKYWKPENIQKNRTLTFENAVSRLRELIVAATRNRMEPGKTGLHVSGGIDSCGVAAIVANHTPDKTLLTGYSWTPEVFEDAVEGTNEKEFIDAFCVDKKVPVAYLKPEENETVRNAIIPEFEIQHIEHPVMKMAGEDGLEILFSGWGGDEFVSLSTRGTINHLFFSFKWSTLLKFIQKKGIKFTIYQFRTDVFPLLVPFDLLPVYKAQYTDWSILRLLKPAFIRKHWKQIFFYCRNNIFGYGDRTRFAVNLLELYHLPERMDSWAINAERYGFEYKYPLLDKDVLEFWFSIPIEFTYKDFHPRLLYREAMKGILTEKIRTRKEKGEALRIAYSLRELKNGKKYLAELFYSLPKQDHLYFFRAKAFSKVINQPWSEDLLQNIRAMNKLTLYLRYVALVKKYLSPDQNNFKKSKKSTQYYDLDSYLEKKTS